MAGTHADFALLCALIADDTRYGELESRLVAGSNLPGPRGNLEPDRDPSSSSQFTYTLLLAR